MGDDERVALLRRAIERFNAGDLDGVLELCHPLVEWPDLMDDKLIWGRDALRDYWQRSLVVVTPRLTPERFVPAGDDVVMVTTQQAFDAASGDELLAATVVHHRYRFRDGLIAAMTHFASLEEALGADGGSATPAGG